ncbi:MAG: PIN domain-containing protein [Pseudomonadota bacterium]
MHKSNERYYQTKRGWAFIGLDTNVLVLYLVQDDKKQAELANRFIEDKRTVDAPGFVNHIVLCELCWVLSGNYKVCRE